MRGGVSGRIVVVVVATGISIAVPHPGLAATGGDDAPVPTTCFSTSLITSQLDDPSQICLPADFNDRLDETIRRNRTRNSDIGWWRFGIKPALFIGVAIVVQVSRVARRKRSQPDFRSFGRQPSEPAPPPQPPFGQTPYDSPPHSQTSPPPPPPPAATEAGVRPSSGGSSTLPPPPPPPTEPG